MKHTLNISGCVIIKEEKILLLYKTKRGYYELPGGKQDVGETLEQTAVREAKEEIGCDVKVIKEINQTEIFVDKKVINSHMFIAKIIRGEPRVMEPDTFKEVKWIPLKEYKNFPLAPNVLDLCRKIELGRIKY
jgi:8-oxo-dGTP diphosphatase